MDRSAWEFAIPDYKGGVSWTLILEESTPILSIDKHISLPEMVYIKSLTDRQKLAALHKRAKIRGIQLSDEAGKYLLHQYSRNTNTLFSILEKLDQASLAAQHKLTIPFIKKVFSR